MARVILRWRGEGGMPAHVADKVRSMPGASLVDTSQRMMVVEGDAAQLKQLADGEANVDCYEERDVQQIAPRDHGIGISSPPDKPDKPEGPE